jgi:hypothetical protein
MDTQEICEMIGPINFESILDLLKTSVPPEISHYRRSTHPGKDWWLKTVIPTNQTAGPNIMWKKIQQKEPLNVLLTNSAVDWFENPIKDAHTVWVRQGIDLVVDFDETGDFTYVVKNVTDSFNEFGKIINENIMNAWEANSQNLTDIDWHNLIYISNLMSGWTSDVQADKKRKMFKVITNEKNNSQTD